MVKLPRKVKVGAITVDVSMMPKPTTVEGSELGLYTSYTGEITINPCVTKAQVGSVLLHEIFHAILDIHGIAHALDLDHRREEVAVRLLEPAVLSLIRDNPELIRWLMKTK